MSGVEFVAPGGRSPYGMLDCRLALTIGLLAPILQSHGVVRVRVDNMYRPRARLPGSRRKRSQHAYGLAIDVLSFTLADGRTLDVESDWHGEIGTAPCGPDAVLETASENAILLRNIVCEVARTGLFHHVLTPSYDVAHKNHVHLDIKRDAKRRMLK